MEFLPADAITKILLESDWINILNSCSTNKRIHSLCTVEFWVNKTNHDLTKYGIGKLVKKAQFEQGLQPLKNGKCSIPLHERYLELVSQNNIAEIGSDRYMPIDIVYANAVLQNKPDVLKYLKWRGISDTLKLLAEVRIAVELEDVARLNSLDIKPIFDTHFHYFLPIIERIGEIGNYEMAKWVIEKTHGNGESYLIDGLVATRNIELLRKIGGHLKLYDREYIARVLFTFGFDDIEEQLQYDYQHYKDMLRAYNVFADTGKGDFETLRDYWIISRLAHFGKVKEILEIHSNTTIEERLYDLEDTALIWGLLSNKIELITAILDVDPEHDVLHSQPAYLHPEIVLAVYGRSNAYDHLVWSTLREGSLFLSRQLLQIRMVEKLQYIDIPQRSVLEFSLECVPGLSFSAKSVVSVFGRNDTKVLQELGLLIPLKHTTKKTFITTFGITAQPKEDIQVPKVSKQLLSFLKHLGVIKIEQSRGITEVVTSVSTTSVTPIDLSRLSNQRGSGKGENKPYTLEQLRSFAKERKLVSSGNKDALVARLLDYENK